MKFLVEKLRRGFDLVPSEIEFAVAQLLSEKIDDAAKAEFLIALHSKGETVDEILGFAQALMKDAVDPAIDPADMPGPMIDIGGTGGTGLDRFNVAPAVMFVLAAGGAVIVKHGSRTGTSRASTENILQELRVPIQLSPTDLRESLKRFGLGFVFAADYHPGFRAIVELRRPLTLENTPTILNLVGPLLNPAQPTRQLIGVFAPRLPQVFAEVLRALSREKAWIVHGLAENDLGLDDISICGATIISELEGKKITSAVLDVAWIGIPRASLAELRGGDARENAATIEGILAGEIDGPKRDTVIANAAGGFVVAGLAREPNGGIALAREQIDSGRALEKLRALQSFQTTSAPAKTSA